MICKLNPNKQVVDKIKQALKDNDGYCPCMIAKTPETKCMCKDFIENVKVGDKCKCGLYVKTGE